MRHRTVCPKCTIRKKHGKASYCAPCGREYRKERREARRRGEPPKIIRARKPICPRCNTRPKSPNQPYCLECKSRWLAKRKGRIARIDREANPMILASEVSGYIAGIIDGEGCITMDRRENKSPMTLIAVGNTNERLIHWLHDRLGGSIRRMHPSTDRCKAVWHWQLYAIEARRLLRAILPHLMIKRRHAEIVLAFHAARIMRHRHNPVVPPEPEPFASLLSELKALNRRGPRPDPSPSP